MRNRALFAVAVVTLTLPAARPDVVDSSANGFTVKVMLNIKSPPDEVYQRLTQNVGDWWNPEHTFSRNSHNLTLDAKAMGCFCEKLPNQGSVRHLEVVYAAPGKGLVLSGAMGPLQTMAAAGNMQIALAPVDGGTKLQVTYSVTGYLPAGMNTWAAPVSAMLTEQFTRLKDYIERGDPAPK